MQPGVDLGGEGEWPLASSARGRTKNCGRDEIVAPGQSETMVEILGDDSKAIYLTCTLDGPRPADGVAFGVGQIPRASAIVEWGNGGLQSRAEIDFLIGCAFSVPCSFLRVIGRNDEDTNDIAPGSVRLGAFAAYLQRTGSIAHAPQRTIVYPTLAPGASAVRTIPAFATNFWLYTNPVSASLLIEFLDLTSTVIAVTSTLFPVVPHANTPIPNGARFVRITNTGGIALISARAIYTIAL